VQIFGAKDMRCASVRPDRLTQLRLTPNDLIRALNEQNAQFAAGKIARHRVPDRRSWSTRSRRRAGSRTLREFENIIVRAKTLTARAAPEGRGARRARLEGLQVHRRLNGTRPR